MADTPTVYVICDQNCKFEGMTKEQILTAITQAVNEGTIGDINTGFVQTIKTINGKALKFFYGTQSEYEALSEEQREGLFALITNDTYKEGIINAINTLNTNYSELYNGLIGGSITVKKAENAVSYIELDPNIAITVGTMAHIGIAEIDVSKVVGIAFSITGGNTEKKYFGLQGMPKNDSEFVVTVHGCNGVANSSNDAFTISYLNVRLSTITNWLYFTITDGISLVGTEVNGSSINFGTHASSGELGNIRYIRIYYKG